MSGDLAEPQQAWPAFELLADRIHATAADAPERVAVIDGERRVTYFEFDALIDRVAAALQRDGVAPQAHDRDLRGVQLRICRGVSSARLRAGVVVAPLAPSRRAASLAEHDARLRGAGPVSRCDDKAALARGRRRIPRISLDGDA